MNQHSPLEPNAVQATKWRRRCIGLIGLWLVGSLLLSFATVRGLLVQPLYVHDNDARGEIAYVMADGFAYWERLHAASNLYNMKRVPRIVILDERELSGYSFVRERSEPLVEKAIAFLEWHGVPRDSIVTVPEDPSTLFGSLHEAQAVAREMPELKQVVVVTSASHTRRSQLCFRRAFPDDVSVQIYSPASPRQSWDVRSPLWIEYLKLAVYYLAA